MIRALSVATLLFTAALLPFSAALAADEEVEVYTDSLFGKNELGLSLHTNYVVSGEAGPEYAGGATARRITTSSRQTRAATA